MDQAEVKQQFNALGIDVVFVDSPLFQIGLRSDSLKWEKVIYPDQDIISHNKKYSVIKVAAVLTFSLDGGRVVENNYMSSPATRLLADNGEESLIKSWIFTMAARLTLLNEDSNPTLFLRDVPQVITLDLKVLSPYVYEEAAMCHGVDEKVFSINQLEDYKTRHVFGRVYYEGIVNETTD